MSITANTILARGKWVRAVLILETDDYDKAPPVSDGTMSEALVENMVENKHLAKLHQ